MGSIANRLTSTNLSVHTKDPVRPPDKNEVESKKVTLGSCPKNHAVLL
jgi:hypothetical protein